MAGRLHIAGIDFDSIMSSAGLGTLQVCDPLLTTPNHSPRQPTSIMVMDDATSELRTAFWGLTPAWLKQLDRAPHCARLDALNNKPMYRKARYYRCAVPVTGIYVWVTHANGKQPFMITRVDRSPLLLAGIREFYPDPLSAARTAHRGKRPPAAAIRTRPAGRESFALVTIDANALIAPFEERLPAILESDKLAEWLSPDTSPDTACTLLSTAPLTALGVFPVSRAINDISCQEWHLSQPTGPMRVAHHENELHDTHEALPRH